MMRFRGDLAAIPGCAATGVLPDDASADNARRPERHTLSGCDHFQLTHTQQHD
jgi:hypothetical protein